MKKHFIWLAIIIASVVLLTALNTNRQIIPGDGIDDSLYYAARIRKVIANQIFLGNPYFIEYSATKLVSFPLADWLAALPAIVFGFSLTNTLLLNQYLWAGITAFLAYALLIKLGTKKPLAAIGAVVLVILNLYLLLRPVSMQIIFPAFLLFCITLVNYLNIRCGRNYLFLVLAAVLAFYLYPYLLLVTVPILFVSFRQKYYRLIILGVLLSLPWVIYYLTVISDPLYFQTMTRIGLIATHLPSVESIKIAVIIVLCLFFNRKPFFVLTGSALLLGAVSNVLTGRELETSIHIGRFVNVWLVIYLFNFQTNYKIFVVSVLAAALLSSFTTLRLKNPDSLTSSLQYLEKQELNPVVVMADDDISSYIAAATKHYVLFSQFGTLHFGPDQELAERYLVANTFNNLSLENIKADYRQYAGAGNAIHQPGYHNYRVRLCVLVKINCGKILTPVEYRGEDYFNDLFSLYRLIKANPEKYLTKYHVNYLLLEKGATDPVPWKAIYEDDNFKLLKRASNFSK